MKVVYKQDMLNNIAKSWKNQYTNDSEGIHKQLLQLKKPISADDIDRIIGNASWTQFKCDNCDDQKDKLVSIVGKYFDGWEGPNIVICEECLKQALEGIQNGNL